MTSDRAAEASVTWQKQLAKLHTHDGLRREDLYAYLGEDLRALWGITPDMKQDADEVYKAALVGLNKLIDGFPFPQGKDKPEIVRRALLVVYNASDLNPKLATMNYDGRRRWLDKQAPEHLQVSDAATRRYIGMGIKTFIASVARQLAEQPDRPQPPPAPELKPDPEPQKHKKRAVILSAIAVAVMAGAVGIALVTNAMQGDAKTSEGSTQPTKGPTASTVSENAFAAGSALRLTAVSLAEDGEQLDVAFPSTVAAARFTPELYKSMDNDQQFFTQEVQAGAYPLGGVKVGFQVENKGKPQATIFSIRPVNRKRSAPLTGAAIRMPRGSNPTDRMTFSMDAPNPTAKVFDKTKAGFAGTEDFFDAGSIPVVNGKTEALSLLFEADQAAYTFDIAIDYTVNGTKYTQTLTNNGQPFRVTASLCTSTLAKSKHMQYGKVLTNGLDATGLSYTLVPSSQSAMCAG